MAGVLLQRVTWRSAAPLIGENLLVIGAVAASAYVQLGWTAADAFAAPEFLAKAIVVAIVAQLCLYLADLYDGRTLSDTPDLMTRLLQSLGLASLCLAAVYLIVPELIVGRGVFVLTVLIAIVGITAWRACLDVFSRFIGPRERMLIIGTGPAEVELAQEVYTRRRDLGVDIVGFVTPDDERTMFPAVPGLPTMGGIPDIPDIVRRHGVDRVVVSMSDARGRLPMDALLDMRLSGVRFDHLASAYEQYTGKIALENLRPSWLVFSDGFRKSPWLLAAKRTIDIVASAAGLVLAAPLMLVAAAAIKLTSPGPALYHQRRTGQRGRLITVHKFRTMRTDAEEQGPQWAARNDPRVTPVGRILRKTRLDELPQLWNVLRGSMSFVGPRPERPEFVADLEQEIPFYGQRHVVKPGLTGWAQVRFNYGASVEDTMEKLQYDLFYIKNLSLVLDLVIIFSTVKTVLLRRGAQ